jgi:hypothetical protein
MKKAWSWRATRLLAWDEKVEMILGGRWRDNEKVGRWVAEL